MACHDAGIDALVPKTVTSNATAEGRFGKADFIYEAQANEYRRPAVINACNFCKWRQPMRWGKTVIGSVMVSLLAIVGDYLWRQLLCSAPMAIIKTYDEYRD